MKQMKLWMMTAILTCGTMVMNAQDTKHEVGISIGMASNSTILSTLEDLTTVPATLGSVKYDNEKYVGPLAVEYFYHITSKIGIGGIASYVNTKKDAIVVGTKQGDAKVNYLTVMPAVKLGWFEREHIGMYSKLAAGVTFRSEKQDWANISENSVKFNFQASFVGLEAGSKTLRGFAELGVGEQGIVLAGVRYKF
ncbi:MAG: hypothetical protein ILA34_03520 [Bacteroidaceae bacterium]|nr:hypothetical protein [Bacteroidaceae bacterium]